MKMIARFIEANNQHIPYLLRKAERIEEYMQQREVATDPRRNATDLAEKQICRTWICRKDRSEHKTVQKNLGGLVPSARWALRNRYAPR